MVLHGIRDLAERLDGGIIEAPRNLVSNTTRHKPAVTRHPSFAVHNIWTQSKSYAFLSLGLLIIYDI